MVRIESPPRSKKLSSTPTSATPRTSDQIRANTRSGSVRGATIRPAAGASGAGSAARSTLPWAVSGSDASTTKADGTM